MATACPSLNFSFKFPIFFSALSGLVGGCFKSSGDVKLPKVGSKSLSYSSNGDLVSAAAADDDVIDTNSSTVPTLLVPGSFFPSTLHLENQNPETIWINSVSVSVLQNEDPSNDPEKISQNPTAYNTPVRINGESNGQAIEIKSIFNNPVKNAGDEVMSELVKSHMDEFSKLMLSGKVNDSDCEAKLLTPMRQVDKLASNGDSIYEAMGPIFTKIDGGVVINMSNPIIEEVLDENQALHVSLPRVIYPPKVFNSESLPNPYFDCRSLADEDFSEKEPSQIEIAKMQQIPALTVETIERVFAESLEYGEKFRGQQVNAEQDKEDFPKDQVRRREYLESRLNKIFDEATEGDIKDVVGQSSCRHPISLRKVDELNFLKNESIETVSVDNVEIGGNKETYGIMTAEESRKWEEEQGQKTRIKSPPSNSFDEFFAEILISKNSKDFFETLNQYVSSFTSGIGGIFPSPAPASPRVEPNNGNGKGK